MRIVQMTSVHPWHDTRVFIKMCKSVAAVGHEVHLVVPRNEGPALEVDGGVTIHSIPMPKNRRERMVSTVSRVLNLSRELQGDIYQFNDPEFLPQAMRFQDRTGKPVVFDSHEDYRLQAAYKPYLPQWCRPLVGTVVGGIEDFTVGRLAGVIAATPSIAKRFENHSHCEVVQNFPVMAEFDIPASEAQDRQPELCGFVGCLSEVRGVFQMISALNEVGPDIRLDLGGYWSPEDLRQKCLTLPGWSQVKELGFMDRASIRSMFSRISYGLVLLHPVQSYLKAYPVKMFEYMAAGLPFIASDFPLWRGIIQEADCGLLADPLDPLAISRAMRELTNNPEMARAMGRRGREAIETQFNWENELKKLLNFYDRLVSN